ncbi:MAG: hypothetical protein MJ133_02830 [Lachnospiraceae bacterium]|nr:hypothetical protein [Lachnospiraceae bacterium]
MVILHVLNAVNLFLLGKMSLEDFRYFSISMKEIVIYLMFGFICGYIRMNMLDLVTALIPGIFLLIIAFISNQKIGYGDALIVLSNGFWLGSRKMFISLSVSMILVFLVSLVMLIRYRYVYKTELKDRRIAFIPFIFTGTLTAFLYACFS